MQICLHKSFYAFSLSKWKIQIFGLIEKKILKWGVWETIRLCWELVDNEISCFWADKWCGNLPLREAFPSLFSIAASKEAD